MRRTLAILLAILMLSSAARAASDPAEAKAAFEKCFEDFLKIPIFGAILGTAVCGSVMTAFAGNECFQAFGKTPDDFKVNGVVDPKKVQDFIKTDCARDQDADGKLDWEDNCVSVANSDQLDTDADGIGDACEEQEVVVACTSDFWDTITIKPTQSDNTYGFDIYISSDVTVDKGSNGKYLIKARDGSDEVETSCSDEATAAKTDGQLMYICELDDSFDGSDSLTVELTLKTGDDDTCRTTFAGDLKFSEAAKLDTDGDGIVDIEDNCPAAANPGQEDGNSNGIGDACDPNFSVSPSASSGGNCSLNGSATSMPWSWLFNLIFLGVSATTIGLKRRRQIFKTCLKERA